MADKVLSNEELNACEQSGNWICPMTGCRKELSRKQTLKTHLQCIHSVEAGTTVKRYKKYEVNEFEPKPKTTKWRCSRLEGGKDNNNSNSEQSYTSHEVHSIDSNIPSDTISDQDTLEDFISYSGSDNRCDEVQNFLGDNLACQNPIQYSPDVIDGTPNPACSNLCGDEVPEILTDNVQRESCDPIIFT